ARHAETVVVADDRGHVRDDDDDIPVAVAALVAEDGLLGVASLDPGETGGLAVELVKRRRVAVEPVEVAHEALQPGMLGLLEQVPVEAAVVAPFALLAELAAHE